MLASSEVCNRFFHAALNGAWEEACNIALSQHTLCHSLIGSATSSVLCIVLNLCCVCICLEVIAAALNSHANDLQDSPLVPHTFHISNTAYPHDGVVPVAYSKTIYEQEEASHLSSTDSQYHGILTWFICVIYHSCRHGSIVVYYGDSLVVGISSWSTLLATASTIWCRQFKRQLC